MSNLTELVKLIYKTKLRVPGVWENIIEPNSRMERLFNIIAEKGDISDEELYPYLYNPGENGAIPSLRNKLKERLLDTVYLLDFKNNHLSNRETAHIECYKKWGAAMILMMRGARDLAVDELEKLLRHSMRFDFTELTLDILRVLRIQYSTVGADFKRYESVQQQYRHYEKIWYWESKAEEYYTDIMFCRANGKKTTLELANQARIYLAELETPMAESDSYKLHLFGRMLQSTVYEILNDYAGTAKVCEDALHFFNEKDYDKGLSLKVFYYNLAVCYLQLRAFEKGDAVIREAIPLFEEGSFNWFKIQELYFLLAMHTGHYDSAYETYVRVTTHNQFKKQLPQILEMWKIFQGYLYLLIKVGKIASPRSEDARKLRLGKLMNEMSVYLQDKSGMNIPILIVKILHSLLEHDYNHTTNDIEAIKKYCSRYLKGGQTFRSDCFIRMLLHLPNAHYHRGAVERKTQKLLHLLQSSPLEAANQTHGVEIIPYETLWELVIGFLDLKIHKATKTDNRDKLLKTMRQPLVAPGSSGAH